MENIEFYLEKVEKKDKEILYRLLQYSLFEESETDLNEMNSDALFKYQYFDEYFMNKDKYAYFIKEKSTKKLLGFVMVNSHLEIIKEGHSIAEFMVIPKYRRNKIGKRVAFEIFNNFKGNWEVKPSFQSEKAYSFWKKTISEYTVGDFEFNNGLFIFSN